MITAAQLRAARAIAGIDQRELARLSGISVPTIQRMEASGGVVRGNVDSLTKLVAALETLGVELIGGDPRRTYPIVSIERAPGDETIEGS